MREKTALRLMLAPFAIGALALVVLPALATAAVAFVAYDGLSEVRWVGLENFRDLERDESFSIALENSATFVLFAVPLRLLAALGLALLLHRRFRGVGAHRTAAYAPTVVPDAAYALLWLFLLNPLFGPVNGLLGALGLPQPGWYADASWAMPSIVLMSVFTVGEAFVVAMAARQELPAALHEAARLEGASALHVLRRITLPLMAPTLALLAVRDVALSLQQSFVPTYLLTDGGPDRATLTLPLYVYDVGFEQLRYGYAAAMTLTTFVLTGVLLLVAHRLLRRARLGLVD